MLLRQLFTEAACDCEACTTLEVFRGAKPSTCKKSGNIGASAEASCRSQGLRRRDTKVKHKLTKKGKRQKISGKKVKGKAHGGPLPDWSKRSKKGSKRKYSRKA